MPSLAASRNGTSIQNCSVAIDGRTFAPETVTYKYDTPHSTHQAVGATVKTQDGNTSAQFTFAHLVTDEELDLLLSLLQRTTTFEITGRIVKRDGTYKDVSLPNCILSTRSLDLKVGSITNFAGECDPMQVLN